MSIFETFAKRFNRNTSAKPLAEVDLERLERELSIMLPLDYRSFMLTVGDAWTPHILDIIVDQKIEMQDIQNFYSADAILHDKHHGWASRLDTDLIPFGSDCVGNTLGFLRNDLDLVRDTASVYLYDHDFGTIEKISSSFSDWIDRYNEL